jgi:MtN3 and saliva related transmembrane protein
MPLIDIIGYTAGLLILISLIPQIMKSWRTKSTGDLSLPRYLIYMSGTALWLAYGIVLKNIPMILTNGICLGLSGTVVYLIVKYGKKKSRKTL